MDCHLNCHGELNALLLAFPFIVGFLRGFWRAVTRRARAVAARAMPDAGPYRTAAPAPVEKPKPPATYGACSGCYAAAAGGCPTRCIRWKGVQEAARAAGVSSDELVAGLETLRGQLGHEHAAGDCQHDRDGEPDREP